MKKRNDAAKKLIVRKQSSNNRSIKNITPLWFQSFKNRIVRRKQVVIPSSEFRFFSQIKSQLSKRIQILGIISLILIAVVGIFVGLNLKSKYDSIEFKPYLNSSQINEGIFKNKTQNIVFINFDRVDTTNIFAKFISILSYNQVSNDLKILSIDPTLVAYYKNKPYTLANLYNNLFEEEDSISRYLFALEESLGVRIDGYIISESQEFSEFILKKHYTIRSDEDFKINNNFIQRGDILNGDNLLVYLGLIWQAEPLTNAVPKQSQFVASILQDNRNVLQYIDNFINAENFTEVFYNNLSKTDIIKFYTSIFQTSNLPIQQLSLTQRDGYLIDIPSGKALIINRIDIDNKVQTLFRDLDVVREEAKIEVLNASLVGGLASIQKKIIQNSGGNVVNFGNYALPEVDKTTLYLVNTAAKDIPNTILLIKSLYPNIEIKTDGYEYNRLGNVILVLGSDNNP